MSEDRTKQIISQLLIRRGIVSPQDQEEYLSERPRRTYDPFQMKNMQQGVDRILSSIREGQKICIYGDYDVDGITSVCILYTVLSHLTEELTWYIPSRFTEGYGVHRQAIESLHRDGVDLIITVDCGITSAQEAAYAESLGMQMLVTDHHQVGDVLPACIVIDPKQPEETYPFRDLAGCGVAYKLAQAIQRQAGLDKRVILEVLDLAALGTVADIVPLRDENRTIVKYGLSKLNERKRQGLAALEEAISLKIIHSGAISFGIAPHLNAAGRIRHAKEAVKLLLADQAQEEWIEEQVRLLTGFNQERKKLQEEAYRKAADRITGEEDIICLEIEGMHEGIAGIAAGRLKDRCARPVILTTDNGEGLLKGTGRSIPGVDLFRLLDAHRELFVRVGGHQKACGFTITRENFQRLTPLLEDDVARLYASDPSITKLGGDFDLEIMPEDATLALCDALTALEPFGEANEVPLFCLRDLTICWPQRMGEQQQHARFTAQSTAGRLRCVLFQKAKDYEHLLTEGRRVDLIGQLEVNEWKNTREVQMIVREIL